MASKERHLAQARSNEAFARELLASRQHIEWVPVATFYAALHYARAYFATLPTVPRRLDHDLIFDLFSKLAPLKPVVGNYASLFTQCNEARYDLFPVYPPVAQEALDKDLQAIKAVILPLLQVRLPAYPSSNCHSVARACLGRAACSPSSHRAIRISAVATRPLSAAASSGVQA